MTRGFTNGACGSGRIYRCIDSRKDIQALEEMIPQGSWMHFTRTMRLTQIRKKRDWSILDPDIMIICTDNPPEFFQDDP